MDRKGAEMRQPGGLKEVGIKDSRDGRHVNKQVGEREGRETSGRRLVEDGLPGGTKDEVSRDGFGWDEERRGGQGLKK